MSFAVSLPSKLICSGSNSGTVMASATQNSREANAVKISGSDAPCGRDRKNVRQSSPIFPAKRVISPSVSAWSAQFMGGIKEAVEIVPRGKCGSIRQSGRIPADTASVRRRPAEVARAQWTRSSSVIRYNVAAGFSSIYAAAAKRHGAGNVDAPPSQIWPGRYPWIPGSAQEENAAKLGDKWSRWAIRYLRYLEMHQDVNAENAVTVSEICRPRPEFIGANEIILRIRGFTFQASPLLFEVRLKLLGSDVREATPRVGAAP